MAKMLSDHFSLDELTLGVKMEATYSRMKRETRSWLRRFALKVTLALSVLSGSLVAEAQQADRVARIAFLATSPSPDSPTTTAIRQGLKELGYVEGRNIIIEWRWGGGKTERFPEFAAEVAFILMGILFTKFVSFLHCF